MIECSGQRKCPNGHWFHLKCVGVSPDNVPDDDWWCSDQCKQYSVFCCKRNIPDAIWIGCSSEKKCVKGEWFHLSCYNLNSIPGIMSD